MDILQSMRLFIRSVDEGSLAAAGRHFGLSAASVSRHINALEDHVGTRLLNRGRKLSLTDLGEEFYQRIQPHLNALKEATDAVAVEAKGQKSTFRIHTRTSIMELIISPCLPKFYNLYPDTQLVLFSSNANAIDMLHRNIDLDIRVDKLADSSLIAKRLSSNLSTIVCSPDYLKKHPRPEKPEDINAHELILFHIAGEQTRFKFRDKNGLVTMITVDGKLQADNGMVLKAAVKHGLGIGLFPRWMITSELQNGELIPLLTDYDATRSSFETALYAMYQKTRYRSPMIRSVIEMLRETINSNPE